ncbi:MAG TPA: hypothetical protein VN634_12175 [Candidatus Limnocylindrales bacterium]|jgi:hypothetical protein|nr:hypothetical protein [Candidatus Limnocylindrales bacterium]
MSLPFPSVAFFEALRAGMNDNAELFRRLGYFDCTFAIRVTENGHDPKQYVIAFDVYECTDVREVHDLAGEQTDFILEADAAVWRDMFANIRANGGADSEHGINTLTHFGEGMRCLYDDPDGHDKMFRFAESIQEFFNLAANVDVDLRAAA